MADPISAPTRAAEAAASPTTRGQRRWLRWTVPLLLLPACGLYGVVAAEAGWRPGEHVHTVAAAGLALALAVLVVTAVRRHGGHAASSSSLVACALATTAIGLVVGDPDNHGGQAGPFDPATLVFVVPLLVAAWIGRPRGGGQPVPRPRRAVTWLTLAAAVPLLAAATQAAIAQRTSWPPASDPHHNGHWWTTAVALAVVVALAAVAARGRPGWRRPVGLASALALGLGLTSVLYPEDASSLGVLGGALLATWGSALAAATAPRLPRLAAPDRDRDRERD